MVWGAHMPHPSLPLHTLCARERADIRQLARRASVTEHQALHSQPHATVTPPLTHTARMLMVVLVVYDEL